jgi:hypothetical protein
MRLTWKDGVTTLLTAAVAALYVAFLAGADLPLASSLRAMAAIAFVAGVAGCALGGGPDRDAAQARSAKWYGGIFGTTALVAGVVALITGNEIALAILVGSIVVLWLASTIRHAFAGPGQARVSDRDLHRLIDQDSRTHS